MIRKLEARGFTYRTRDGIYFDTSKDPGYGELARLQLEQQETQERVEGADEKRNRADFALWKLTPAGRPEAADGVAEPVGHAAFRAGTSSAPR